jgi:Domain of unknown function (DUF4383)
MQSNALARAYMGFIGITLVVVGLLGFISNPIVGDVASNPLFITGTNHNIVHLLTGALALYVAFGLSGSSQAMGTIAFGGLYLVVFVALLISPDLFGLLYKVSIADHFLHAGIGFLSVAVGVMARGSVSPMRA